MEPLLQSLARAAYERYTATTDNKNYQGLPCPAYDDLTPKIKEAWEAAVQPQVADNEIRRLAHDAMFLLKDLENGDYIGVEHKGLAQAICEAFGLDWDEVKAR